MKLKMLLLPMVAVAGLVLSGCESLHYRQSSCPCDPCCCCTEADCEPTGSDGEKPAEPYDEAPKPQETAPPPPPKEKTAGQPAEQPIDETAQRAVDDTFEQFADPNALFEEE